jgi:dTDP-glucose pyrophosphorylase
MWGIIPAAGRGSRIQPLAFSKELLPVGTRSEGGTDRPMAVTEHLVERMLVAGVNRLCFVISPGKSDILNYFGGRVGNADICYVIQDRPRGLCDALFRALPLIADDDWVCAGLPDTIWFPETGLAELGNHPFSFLLFPVAHPDLFDAVTIGKDGAVELIEVKAQQPKSNWIWGAFKLRGHVLRELHALWCESTRKDEYLGTLVNEYVKGGAPVRGEPLGTAYVDVGTLHGYREATTLLEALRLVHNVRMVSPPHTAAMYRSGLTDASNSIEKGV